MVEGCSWRSPLHSRPEFPPLACWGLRRGITHRPAGQRVDVPCQHVTYDGTVMPDSICMPLAAQHGTLGMLYLERQPGIETDELAEVYLKTLAENIGLALDNLRLRDALRGQAMADPLTGLANRRHMEAVLETELAQAERHHTPISGVMLDIDHFKRFNDEYGHDAGDTVLKAVATVLKQSVREQDIAFRYGGEEFLLLIPGVDADGAAERAEDIRSQIAELRVRHDGRSLGGVTASLGVATTPDHCMADRLVQTADAALLQSKRNGRNQVSLAQTRRATDTAAG
jgi:diguanylate cyclase (GGDEF)-like protein